MTLPELGALARYWKRNPPVHIAVAAYLGLGKADAPKRSLSTGDLQQVAGMFGPSKGTFKPPARMQ